MIPLFLSFWLLHLALLLSASPTLPNDDKQEAEQLLARRQSSYLPITGIQEFGVQPRLEIRQLQQDADQWNLFLLGLSRFQNTNQSAMNSYYQIAGIHGRPYTPWNGVGPAPHQDSPGFCQHVSNVFVCWHRPYLALFEQTLFRHIVQVVDSFPAGHQRQRYAEAALSWRLPYWDWAMTVADEEYAFPLSMQAENVTVTMPNGTNVIPNPLYAYRFHPVSVADFYYSPFALWNQTKRYPTSWAINATSQDALLSPILANNQVSFQNRLYNLFTFYDNFTEFGNEAWMQPGISNADSLESLHDVIHSIVGSNGHMTYLDYSAFDPSFWLHHAMVDRCFALWQAIYPDSYVEPMAAVEQTYNVAVGTVQTENTSLEPFTSTANGTFWTAASARSTHTFGYTYPELEGQLNVSAVKAAINKLYGSNVGSAGISRRGTDKRRSNPAVDQNEAQHISDEVVDGEHRQYIANIISQKFALNGSYAIYLFTGDFNPNPATWPTSSNLVGTHAVFAALALVDASSNPQSKAPGKKSIPVTGSIPLTATLLSKVQSGTLANMAPASVESYLQGNLQWTVAMFDGTEVPVEDVSDLTVTVVSAEVEPAASIDQFPRWSNFTALPHITRGKKGGCP